MENQLPDDGLKWFGEGFDGFPKRLPDDCVEYVIYIIDQKVDSINALRTRLNAVLKAANDLKKKLLKDYIWQRDSFDLTIHPRIDTSEPVGAKATREHRQTPPHLQGRTDFGDSVADEWLIVYLLSEISKQFPDAWIRVYDTDGEFLLIEAANSLPKWLNPEIAENRVWLNDGHLKIISLDEDSTPRNLSLQDAVSAIQDTPKKMLVCPAIEQEAFYRLREYPSAISSSFHHALITIPKRLAYILHRNPAYISPAVESFYLRDPVSLKPLATKDLSTLNFPPEDFVTVSVKFTKVGFAQLRSQAFDPPPAWTGIIPRMHDEKVAMGMKLTCGFEMLVSDPQNQDKRTLLEIKLLLEDLDSGEEALPTDADIAAWPKTQNDETWLDIDYNEFEKELSGKAGSSKEEKNDSFGDKGAQENLRKMVSRFQDFLEDDEAGADGVGELDDDGDGGSDASSDENDAAMNEKDADEDEMNFRGSMKEIQAMSTSQVESSGLLEEARKLALQDDEDASDVDEDEEMRKVMELMKQELKSHGALNISDDGKEKVIGKGKGKGKGKAPASNPSSAPATKANGKPHFGPERPPHLQSPPNTSQAISKKSVHFNDDEESADEELVNDDFPVNLGPGPGDGELSSDDENFNDIDLGLAKNMLEAFKGQAGMAGPAGNLMKALGVGMPRDEDDGEA